MSLLPTFIITAPNSEPVYHDHKNMLQLAKKAVGSPKYKAWLKKSHFLPVWSEPIDGKDFTATKWEYIRLYLEQQGYKFEEI